MEAFPDLSNIDEIEKFISSRPASALADAEVISELGHWNTLCRTRYWEECRENVKHSNPASKVNIIRLGCLSLGLLAIVLHVFLPPVGLTLAASAICLEVYNEMEHSEERAESKRIEKPINVVHQRCKDLELELETRSKSSA
jgi:hypothetical protein